MKRRAPIFALFATLGLLAGNPLLPEGSFFGTSAHAAAKPAPRAKTPAKPRLTSPVAFAGAWAQVDGPTQGKPAVHGGYAQGCIAGAVPLPLEGPGYQVMRTGRHRYYGHPSLIAYVRKLTQATRAARLPGLLVGDLSQPRGGPMTFGHSSHQTGLDVDIWFRFVKTPLSKAELERPEPLSLIDADSRAINPDTWTQNHARLLRIAASFPEVERIFVNPVIKRMLCETERENRAWLYKLRPWRGHDEHFHVRLRCPEEARDCIRQAPLLPDDDGCGEELDEWIDSDRPLTFPNSVDTQISDIRLPGTPPPKPVRNPPPPECLPVLQAK